MRRKVVRKSFLIFLGKLLLCGTFYLPTAAQQSQEQQEPPIQTSIKPSSKSQGKLPFAIRDNSPMSSVNIANYQQVATDYKTQRKIALRNRLIFMAVSQIDLHFRSNERKVRHRNRLFQTVISILEVGAATAISITNGERAKSIIADGLGFIQGSRDTINKNYRMLDRQILVNKMVEKRAKILATIYDRVGKSDEEYPFERAFIDLLDYFEAGRIDSALTELAKDSGSTAVNAEEKLKVAKAKADITLASSSETLRIAEENEEIVQAIADSEFAASEKIAAAKIKITAANEKIKAATDKIAAAVKVINSSDSTAEEKEKSQQAKKQAEADKAKAEADKAAAETDKAAAEKIQTAEMNKYKKIVKAIDENPKLYVILDKLPNLYDSEDADVIEDRVNKVRNGTATAEEYGLVILRFYERISELVGTDAESVAKSVQILKEATKEEKANAN